MQKLTILMKTSMLVSVLACSTTLVAGQKIEFTYSGFRSANLSLDGEAEFTSNGLLKLTNDTTQTTGHAFYPDHIKFKNSTNGSAFSFSTTFVFGIISEYPKIRGHGIAFVIAPQRGLPGALASAYLGLFNETDNKNSSSHVIAVELDTIQNKEFRDINDNHVGIDVNGLISDISSPAGYYVNGIGGFKNLSLVSGLPMQVWVDYDGAQRHMNVTLAPFRVTKPSIPLLSYSFDLSKYINEMMYVGFSSSTGSVLASHYVLGWSFKINGQAQALTVSQLPKLPKIGEKPKSKLLTVGLPIISVFLFAVVTLGVGYFIRRKRKFAEIMEDWELDYGPNRFKYKDLYIATKGFRDQELLGTGGFGRVYKGVMTKSKNEIAVKRVSHESRQGMREFVAEIVSIGRLRHRNLVTLLGYCRQKGELLLVYEYMPNGSLDKYLFNQPKVTLNWRQRFHVIKGVASVLFYLHEGWEQVVIHRDIKASNVLLDAELNGRLGDFGLARLYDHGTDPQTTHVVGTLGYLAPEHTRLGKATTNADVFAFGAFLLEVATGRRPIEVQGSEDLVLVDWVFSCWKRGEILEAKDPNLRTEFVVDELELVLKLGLLCSNFEPSARPSMRQVVQYLEGDMPLPDLSTLGITAHGLTFAHREGFDDFAMSHPSSTYVDFSHASTDAESLLSGGRWCFHSPVWRHQSCRKVDYNMNECSCRCMLILVVKSIDRRKLIIFTFI